MLHLFAVHAAILTANQAYYLVEFLFGKRVAQHRHICSQLLQVQVGTVTGQASDGFSKFFRVAAQLLHPGIDLQQLDQVQPFLNLKLLDDLVDADVGDDDPK